jgi:protein SCO1/2
MLAALLLIPARPVAAAEAAAPEVPASAEHACCKPAAPKPDACCAAKTEAPAATKPAACCAAAPIENPVAGRSDISSSKIENSPLSLYQADATFTDDTGAAFSLGSLRGRPVVLNLFFASCGYACPLTVTDLLAVQARLPAALRNRAVFVLVSFDVARDTPAALAKYRAQRGLGAQWVLLHGDDNSVRELAALAGVKFKQEADGAFSHSNLVTILNAEGEIVHQRTGLSGGLDEAAAALSKLAQ